MEIMPKKNIFSAGFTLLEMIVSLAIIALVSVVLSQVFIATIRTNTKTELQKDMKQNGELALETIVRMVQSAQNATCTTTQSLTVINPDAGITTFECALDGTTTRLASTSAEGTAFLTSSNASLGGSACSSSSLNFSCSGGTGIPSTVTITFTLSQTGSGIAAFEQASESFQTSAVMRNTPK